MLIPVDHLGAEEFRRLMDIYAEGNQENGAYLYRDDPPEVGVAKAEKDFEDFLRTQFMPKPENSMYVWQIENQWVAALRLTRLDDFYYLEALETKPDQRKKGYAAALLRAVCQKLEEAGPLMIRDCVRKTNEASLRTHLAVGFTVDQDPGVEYPDGKPNERYYGMLYRRSDAR